VLYRPDAFEPLTTTAWSSEAVRDRIGALVADTDAGFRGPRLFWIADEWDRWHGTSPMKTLYTGSAGVIWALDALRRRGYAESQLDLADLATMNLELFLERPDYMKGIPLPVPRESALLAGETGVRLVAWRLAPTAGLADRIHELVRGNVDNDAVEVMWGSPGTLLVARAFLDWTGDERWRDAWNESAEALLARRDADGLWTQQLYGQEQRSLTPPHGLVGIVGALAHLLDDDRRTTLERESASILRETAVVEGKLANWPPRRRPELPGPDGQIRVQWCAGAPGMVIGAAQYLDEDLLLAGAELVWQAGPPTMEKGPGICHGTAGNGYALLAAFARTGDELWLERARRFAVHALEQVERGRAERGRGRYSLWTGDLGVALFTADCIESKTSYPVVGSLDW
jgi:hypothetical protein